MKPVKVKFNPRHKMAKRYFLSSVYLDGIQAGSKRWYGRDYVEDQAATQPLAWWQRFFSK